MAKEYPDVEFRGLDLGASSSGLGWTGIEITIGHSPPLVHSVRQFPSKRVTLPIMSASRSLTSLKGCASQMHQLTSSTRGWLVLEFVPTQKFLLS